MSAVSASDAWATGPSGDTKPLMMHWDGSTWTRVTVPDRGFPSLSSVSADSPSDAWAVGTTNGSHVADVALHWNGTKWAQVAVPSPGRSFSGLGSVSAAAPDDVGVAGNLVTGVDAALVLHWNGTSWSQAALPRLDGDLAAVTALSPKDAWAVGHYFGSKFDKSLVLHWNGTAWTRQSSPNPSRAGAASINTLNGVNAVSGTDAWAVGFYGRVTGQGGVDKTLILHWNGSTWVRQASPSVSTSSGLDSVAALSPTDAWATGRPFPTRALGPR